MLEIPLKRGGEVPLYRQLARHLERMIRSGALSRGEKLPGSRSLSDSLGVSRMTVIEAYRYLEDRGYVMQKGRSGAYVAGHGSPVAEDPPDPSPGFVMDGERPSLSLIPSQELSRLTREVLTGRGAELLRDCPLAGSEELRRRLVFHSATRGIPGEWQDVVVTSGGRQGISVSFAALRESGVSSVLMDELNYPYAWLLAHAEGLEVIPFRSEDQLLELMSVASSDCAVYLVPSFSNPTGITMSREGREAVLGISHERGLWIVEDDSYGELRYGQESVPALRSMDDGKSLVYLGSFSQALFPGMRLGYSLVPSRIRDSFLGSLARRGGPVSSLVQSLAEAFIASGGLEMSLERVRQEMALRMRRLSSELDKTTGVGWSHLVPQGGIYLWLRLPGLDGERACVLAMERGVSVAPGRAFSFAGHNLEAVRLSVSEIESSSISSAVARLRMAWSGYLSS